MIEKIIDAFENFKIWLQRNIEPRVYRLRESLIDIRGFLGPLGLYYIEDTIEGIYNFFTNLFIKLATLTYEYAILPIVGLVKSTYYAIKSIGASILNFLDTQIRNLYTYIAGSHLFITMYDLLKLDETWPTSENQANEIARITHSVAWIMFFTLSITPLMLLFVGVPGNYWLTFSVFFMFSFAVGISFGATFAHNRYEDHDKAAITSIIFLALMLLGLIYLSISMNAIFINFVSIIIGIGTICFTIAQQKDMKESKIFGRFHTTNYISSESEIYYRDVTDNDDIGINDHYPAPQQNHTTITTKEPGSSSEDEDNNNTPIAYKG